MIQINNLIKKYKGFELNIPDLAFLKNETIGIIGNNGAGKTTLFYSFLDLVKMDSGSIKIENNVVNETDDWKNITSAYIDESFLIGFLTPFEYFYFMGELRNFSKAQIDDFLKHYHAFLGDEILENKDRYIQKLSKGNKKKVGLVGAFLNNCGLIILDEPFTHLDPSSKIQLLKILNKLKSLEKTIIISSHEIDHVLEIIDRVLILEKGMIIKDLPISDESKKITKDYFLNQAQ